MADWIDPSRLTRDPYPAYRRLLDEARVAWVPSVNRYLVTGYAECREVELDQRTFSANISGRRATMVRALGENPMLRKDDPEHAVERRCINPTLRPKAINETWRRIFDHNARSQLDYLEAIGSTEADLNRDFAAPLASQNLIDLLGLPGVDTDTMHRWSSAFIAGTGNLADDEDVWMSADVARAEVDALVSELTPHYRLHPNASMTSALIHGGLPAVNVAANVKLTITGGMNEPQHMVTNMVWALDRHPDQRRRVLADPTSWPTAFDETARWLSPIGMYPRETTKPTVLGGLSLPAGAAIGVVVGAANRDPSQFGSSAADFDIGRPRVPHLAFGSGVHLCAGHWAAKASIGQIAVPMLYERFPNLRVDESRESHWEGWVFRGLTSLPVSWSGAE